MCIYIYIYEKYKNKNFIDVICINNIYILIIDNIRKGNYTFNDEWYHKNNKYSMKNIYIYILKILRY